MGLPINVLNQNELVNQFKEVFKTSKVFATYVATAIELPSGAKVINKSPYDLGEGETNEEAVMAFEYLTSKLKTIELNLEKNSLANNQYISESLKLTIDSCNLFNEFAIQNRTRVKFLLPHVNKRLKTIFDMLVAIEKLLKHGQFYSNSGELITNTNFQTNKVTIVTPKDKGVKLHNFTVYTTNNDIDFMDKWTLTLNGNALLSNVPMMSSSYKMEFKNPVKLNETSKLEFVFNNNNLKQKIIRFDYTYEDIIV